MKTASRKTKKETEKREPLCCNQTNSFVLSFTIRAHNLTAGKWCPFYSKILHSLPCKQLFSISSLICALKTKTTEVSVKHTFATRNFNCPHGLCFFLPFSQQKEKKNICATRGSRPKIGSLTLPLQPAFLPQKPHSNMRTRKRGVRKNPEKRVRLKSHT